MSLALLQIRRRPAVTADGARAVLRFRDGAEIAVDIDAENGSYLRQCVRRPRKARFAWFETRDGFLIGANPAAIAAVDWPPPGATTTAADTRLDRDHLVLRFSDGRAQLLSPIAGDDIDRLRGATLCEHGDPPDYTSASLASIPVERLVLATLPSAWMDADATEPPVGAFLAT